MYYKAIIEGISKVVFIENPTSDPNVVHVYSSPEDIGKARITPKDLCEVEYKTFEPCQLQLLNRIYVISLVCYRESGPWPETVFCILGPHSHLLDDGDSFLVWCHTFRTSIRKKITPNNDSGSASIPTSIETFQSIFGPFKPHHTYMDMGYSTFHFTPPKNNITSRDKGFISGFTKKETVTSQLVDSYANPTKVATSNLGEGYRLVLTKGPKSIPLGNGLRSEFKTRLTKLSKTSHPSVPYVNIFKENVNGKYSVYQFSLNFDQIRELESLVGQFTRKGNRAIREKTENDLKQAESCKFKIIYCPSKFRLRVKFSHLSD